MITITPTKQRALNLCDKLRDAGLASRRFWFTIIEHISADEPAKILEKIFFTPKDFEDRALRPAAGLRKVIFYEADAPKTLS